MSSQQLLKEALNISPIERTLLIDGLLSSRDEPDRSIDDIWHIEIEKRVDALRKVVLRTIPHNEDKLWIH